MADSSRARTAGGVRAELARCLADAERGACVDKTAFCRPNGKTSERKSGEKNAATAAWRYAVYVHGGALDTLRAAAVTAVITILHALGRPSVCCPVCHVWSRNKRRVDHCRLHVRLEMLRNLQTSHG